MKEIVINNPLFLIFGRCIVLQNYIKKVMFRNLAEKENHKTLNEKPHFHHI